jgi:hypothetical protein
VTRVAEPLAVVVPAAGPVVAAPDDFDGTGETRDDGRLVGVTAEVAPRVAAWPGAGVKACPLFGCGVPLTGVWIGRSFSQAARVSTKTRSAGITM